MIYLACSVYDKSIQAYLPPFFCRSQGEAIRSFTDACSDAQHQFCRHPEDYVLMEMFRFDDNTGAVEAPATGPTKLITAMECVKVVDQRST